jgi:hypothetical protein
MQISLRSNLIAGTAAVVGASAIAMTPVTGVHPSLPSVQVPSAVQVALAGFDSPLSELIATGEMAGSYLFNTIYDPKDPSSWWFSGITTGTGGGVAWPNPLLGTAALGGYSSVGLIPQFIDDALPIISQLGYNGSSYIDEAIYGLGGAAYTLSEGVWNAAGQLLKFDIPGAVQTLLGSVSYAGQQALSSGQYVLTNVLAKATAVVKFLVSEIPTVIGATVGQIKVLTKALIKPVTDVIAAFSGPKPLEGAWNAVVDGIFGPSGIPGTVLNLTIGAGVQTDPISGNTQQAVEDSIKANFVPSIRTEVQAAVKGVAGALQTVPASAASRRSAASVKAPKAAAAVGDSTTAVANKDSSPKRPGAAAAEKPARRGSK